MMVSAWCLSNWRPLWFCEGMEGSCQEWIEWVVAGFGSVSGLALGGSGLGGLRIDRRDGSSCGLDVLLGGVESALLGALLGRFVFFRGRICRGIADRLGLRQLLVVVLRQRRQFVARCEDL